MLSEFGNMNKSYEPYLIKNRIKKATIKKNIYIFATDTKFFKLKLKNK